MPSWTNEVGEPIMDGAAWRYEQSLDQREPEYDPDDYLAHDDDDEDDPEDDDDPPASFCQPAPIIGATHLVVSEEGHLFEPWTDGWAIGFKVTHGTTGVVRYVYLNPSSSDEPTGDSNAFVYVGPDGDPALNDSPACYIDPFKD